MNTTQPNGTHQLWSLPFSHYHWRMIYWTIGHLFQLCNQTLFCFSVVLPKPMAIHVGDVICVPVKDENPALGQVLSVRQSNIELRWFLKRPNKQWHLHHTSDTGSGQAHQLGEWQDHTCRDQTSSLEHWWRRLETVQKNFMLCLYLKRFLAVPKQLQSFTERQWFNLIGPSETLMLTVQNCICSRYWTDSKHWWRRLETVQTNCSCCACTWNGFVV